MALYEANQRARREARADLIEDLLNGGADTEKGIRAALQRVRQLRKR